MPKPWCRPGLFVDVLHPVASSTGGVATVVHGDGFCILGHRKGQAWCHDKLAERIDVGETTILGTEAGDAKQVRILNRILSLTETGLLYEADPSHVEHITPAHRLHDRAYRAVPGHGQRHILSEEECGVGVIPT